MTSTKTIRVTVFGNPGHEYMGPVNCCAPPFTSEETTEMLVDHLDSKYNGRATVEYVDLSSTENQSKFPDVVRAASQDDVAFPLVAIDGELKVSGEIDFALICREIERRS